MSFRVKIWSVYVHPLLKLNWLSLSLLFSRACFLVHRHSSKCILKHSKQANASWVLYSFLPPPFLFLQLAVITSEYQGQVLPQLWKSAGNTWCCPTGDTFDVSTARRMRCFGTAVRVSHGGLDLRSNGICGATALSLVAFGHDLCAWHPYWLIFFYFFFLISQPRWPMLFSTGFHCHF